MRLVLSGLQPRAPYRSWVRGPEDAFLDGSPDHVAEVVRAQAAALGPVLRTQLVRRVVWLLPAELGAGEERIEEVCDALERRGDLFRAPGGLVVQAPLRMVETSPERFLVSGVAPTVVLRERLPFATIQGGIGRVARVPSADREALLEGVRALGGRCLSAAEWSRLSRTPAADDAWLAGLEQRLTNEGMETAALTARWDEPFVYRARGGADGSPAGEGAAPLIQPGKPLFRWERASLTEHASLLRARQIGGWQAYGYGVLRGAEGAPRPLIALTPDEARRTERALDRAASATRTLLCEVRGGLFWTALTVVLPSAEYRYLLVHAEATDEGARPMKMGFSPVEWALVTGMLRERLGIETLPGRSENSIDTESKNGS